MKVMFLVPYPREGASNRFRIEQYRSYLESRGVASVVRPFIIPVFYRILYNRGFLFQKICFFIWCSLRRLCDVLRAVFYDVIVIHRESYPLGPPFIERFLKLIRKRIVFDFDDAIFLPASSGTHAFLERFKRYGKVPEVLALSSHVIAGNQYLADFAIKYNERVTIIPTSVDTEMYAPSGRKNEAALTVGWIGSKTTSVFLNELRPVFRACGEKFPKVTINIVGGEFDAQGLTNVRNIPWTLEEEAETLQQFDIGIMPMPDTKWTRGKCAFKAILYMSVGIPCIASPVGVTVDIIEHGINGYCATTMDEWKNVLFRLIRSPEERKMTGDRARRTIVENYSIRIHAPRFYDIVAGSEGVL